MNTTTTHAGVEARLRRIRWAVRVALTVGVAASVAANVLHANPDPIAQAIAAWPPLALLLTVELVARVPVHRRSLSLVRVLATTVIASIAAWVSYWHMAGVATRYGETGASAYLLPISVDGLIVVASICLVELSGRIDRSDPTPSVHTGQISVVDPLRSVRKGAGVDQPGLPSRPARSGSTPLFGEVTR